MAIRFILILALAFCSLALSSCAQDDSVEKSGESDSTPADISEGEVHADTTSDRPGTQGDAESPMDQEVASPEASNSTYVRPTIATRPVVESQLVDKNGLRADQLGAIIATDKFEPMVQRMQSESDADSLDMTKLYRASVEKTLAKDKRFALSSLACGAQVCAATFNSSVEDEAAFAELVMAPAEGIKKYSAIMQLMPPGDGRDTPQYRIVFSTDPRINSLPADAHVPAN